MDSAVFLILSLLTILEVMNVRQEPLSSKALAFCCLPWLSMRETHVPRIMAVDVEAVLHTGSVIDTSVVG